MSSNNDVKSNSPRTEDDIASLTSEFQEKLPRYIDQINDVWQNLSHINWNPRLASSLRHFCHRLAGSSGTYGFSDISKCVADIEATLIKIHESPVQLTAQTFKSIEQNIQTLISISIDEPETIEVADIKLETNTNYYEKPIYVVDDDEDSGLFLKSLLEKNGFQCQFFNNIKEAIIATANNTPCVVFMDVNFPEGRLAGIEAISKLRETAGFRLPIIMNSSRSDYKIRMESANNGCDGFLSKPINVEELSISLERVLKTEQFHDKRVLIIDDDTSVALYYRAILNKMDIDSKHINDPMKSIELITDYRPHLILLDNMMPGCTGLDLAKLLKQDPKLINTGIIFITADHDFKLDDNLLSLGVNGVLFKPVEVEQFKSSIREFLLSSNRFSNKIEHIVHKNPLNTVANQNYFYSSVEKLIISKKTKKFGLLLISFSTFESIKKKFGMAKATLIVERLGDKIEESLQESALATRFGDSNYIVFYQHDELNDIINYAKNLSENLNKYVENLSKTINGVTLKYSLAPSANNNESIETLISRCETSLKQSTKQNVAISYEFNQDGSALAINAIDQSSIEQSLQNRQFGLVFQPIFSLSHRDENHFIFDTFVRLNSVDDKTFSPDQFFPFIKDKKTFSKLDHFVIENVIKQLANLNRSLENKIYLQARLSDQALTNRDTLLWISNSLNNSRIMDKDTLIFELSETSLVKSRESAKYFIDKVKLLGCQVAITNFGETTHSLELLREFRPGIVKFNATTLLSKENMVAKEAISQLLEYAKPNKVDVIACQVENAEMITQLYSMNIPLYQGYFINRPTNEIDLSIEQSLQA